MKFIPVDSVPDRRYRHPLQDMIEEFSNGENDIVKVDITERDYKSARSCYSCLHAAIKKSRHPVKVMFRDGEVFLSKIK